MNIGAKHSYVPPKQAAGDLMVASVQISKLGHATEQTRHQTICLRDFLQSVAPWLMSAPAVTDYVK